MIFALIFDIQKRSTPLNSAAEKGHTDTVKLLLEEGAKIDTTNVVSIMTSGEYITVFHETLVIIVIAVIYVAVKNVVDDIHPEFCTADR
jgi:ankyrin repeat protein